MSKILKVVSNTLLIVLIVILSIYLVLKFTDKIGIYRVITGSMEYGIHRGDYIVVVKTKNYKEGDVVTYVQNGYYITHRIIKMNDNSVITKGDANNVEDGEIDKSDIIGKYIYKSIIINIILDYKYILISGVLVLFIISCFVEKKKQKV